MIANASYFAFRSSRTASVATRRQCLSHVTDRRCLLSDERRDCLARLRQIALAETAQYLTARLVKNAR
jgi:hypothetical protein